MHLFKSQLFQEPRQARPPARRHGVRNARAVAQQRGLPPPRLVELEALHVLRVGCEQVALRGMADRAA